MAGTLKSMLENLDHFVDILALSQTAYVKDWDVCNVQRALEWGTYFQQVYHRFNANDTIRRAIEDHLTAKNDVLRVQFKNYKHVTFGDLVKAKAMFGMALLYNSAVSTPVFKHLVELLQDSAKVDPLSLDHILSQKVASDLFLSLPLFACEGSQKPLEDPVLVTQADLFGSSLQRRIKMLEDDQKLSVVSDVLCKLPQPLVYNLIAVLLFNGCSDHRDQVQDLILDWLLSDDAAWTGFCHCLDPQDLARMCSRFLRFRQTYLDYLIKLGHGMEQDVRSGTLTSNNPKMSFREFLEHFRCLLRGPKDLREWTSTRLQTLKFRDGDYEVSGISIWTDILAELNKL